MAEAGQFIEVSLKNNLDFDVTLVSQECQELLPDLIASPHCAYSTACMPWLPAHMHAGLFEIQDLHSLDDPQEPSGGGSWPVKGTGTRNAGNTPGVAPGAVSKLTFHVRQAVSLLYGTMYQLGLEHGSHYCTHSFLLAINKKDLSSGGVKTGSQAGKSRSLLHAKSRKYLACHSKSLSPPLTSEKEATA